MPLVERPMARARLSRMLRPSAVNSAAALRPRVHVQSIGKAGQGRARQGKAGQGRAGQGRAGPAGQDRAGQGKQCILWSEWRTSAIRMYALLRVALRCMVYLRAVHDAVLVEEPLHDAARPPVHRSNGRSPPCRCTTYRTAPDSRLLKLLPHEARQLGQHRRLRICRRCRTGA